jgi:hypothetical protein
VTDRWYKHPRLPVKVNEAGTHIYNTNRKKFLQIRRVTYKYSPDVVWKCCIAGGEEYYSRIALECFTKVLLVGEMTCDHRDCNGDNNCITNLSAKGRLFQSNHMKIHRDPVKGKVVGVNRQGNNSNNPGWEAYVRAIKIDRGVGRTQRIRKRWSDRKYGYEEGRKEAIAFRQKHTPRLEEMIDNSSVNRKRSSSSQNSSRKRKCINSSSNRSSNRRSNRSSSSSSIIIDEVPSSTL